MAATLPSKVGTKGNGADNQPEGVLTSAITDVSVPELDALLERGVDMLRTWTMREDALLKKYYGKFPNEFLCNKLFPSRTSDAMQKRAKRIGVKRSETSQQ